VELRSFAEVHNIPVVETIVGRGMMLHEHPRNAGPLGVIGSSSANVFAAEADVVLAVGTRQQDFTTGSWSVFGNERMRLISLNAARYDTHKHHALSLVSGALVGIGELDKALSGWSSPASWTAWAQTLYGEWNRTVEEHSRSKDTLPPSYAHVVGAVNRVCDKTDLALTAAGGFPGEL
jgi:3D-(3,5/4)-trihydroxycyclohexane-1,2-dione acylhydrolase (decyclizing)